MTFTTYYIWKWADNDVPGKPNEVFAALMRGTMHPALQVFDSGPFLQALEQSVARRRQLGEEWEWTVCPDEATGLTRFVIVTGSELQPDYGCVGSQAWQLALAWYDEQEARIAFGPPKRNCMSYAQLPWVYEATEAELPVLLRQITSLSENPYAILTDRRFWYVQTFTDGKRWIVEWRENYDLNDPENFDHWVAGHRPLSRKLTRIKSANGRGVPCRRSEVLTYAEVLGVFRAFLHGEPRPCR